MGKITIELLRKRSEHNDGCLANLEEISLHQQNIESIQLLGQLCPKLKILYLQNNLIGRIQNLHKLKDLEYLNLALNNIQKIENLERCEFLMKLDLTINFISKTALSTVKTLKNNLHLKELYLSGNPCTDFTGYRQFVIGTLPQLKKLDGIEITVSERLNAIKEANTWTERLNKEIEETGEDLKEIRLLEEGLEVEETGSYDDKGEFKRPWCPETRILEHRESEIQNQKNNTKKQNSTNCHSSVPLRRTDFPQLIEGTIPFQKNEGGWDFTLEESHDTDSMVLDIALSPYMDLSSIKADVQENFIRLLIKGRLLQLQLPCPVISDFSKAERSLTTGHLVITMPKHNTNDNMNTLYIRPKQTPQSHSNQKLKSQENWMLQEVNYATMVFDQEEIPSL